MTEFHENLTRLCAERSMSQTDLSRATGLARPQINRYWLGRNKPTFAGLLAIRAALDCPWDELLGKAP